MRNKFGWFLILIEILIIGWLTTKYWSEIRNFVGLLTEPEVIETVAEKKIIEKFQKVETEIPPSPTLIIKKIIYPTPTPDNEPWGVARQIDDVTWTMKVGQDETMATAREIFDALNQYRQTHGSQILTWDTKLAEYAQNRAKYLNSQNNVDGHKGFNDFVQNEDGFNKLGFTMLGENISFGYKLNGVHTIEWMYAGDKPHNDNQLDNRWNYVGIGVDALATCLIFGTGKF